MTQDRPTRITYRGNPAFASMLAQMLKDEGVAVEWERPEEQRGLGDMAQAVIVEMVASGSLLAVKVAVDKFRKHTHGRAEATVEIEDHDDDPTPES